MRSTTPVCRGPGLRVDADTSIDQWYDAADVAQYIPDDDDADDDVPDHIGAHHSAAHHLPHHPALWTRHAADAGSEAEAFCLATG